MTTCNPQVAPYSHQHQQRLQREKEGKPAAGGGTGAGAGAGAGAGTGADGGDDAESPSRAGGRQARSRLLVPSDRKALYQLISLTIDPRLVPAGTRITVANCMDFVPPECKGLLEGLREVLLFEC